ncbi:MAG: hypothetical protein KJ067_20175 [Vicinamibacteria bacterium]|jgi:hypothetical protein|nr:hypothetical protein [Vicinamibacteria bacterium]
MRPVLLRLALASAVSASVAADERPRRVALPAACDVPASDVVPDDSFSDRDLRRLNPLAEFRIDRGRLAFRNLGDERKLAAVEGYDVEWWACDDGSGERLLVAESARFSTPSIAIPRRPYPVLVARLRTASAAEPRWRKAIEVVLRRAGDGFDIASVGRED